MKKILILILLIVPLAAFGQCRKLAPFDFAENVRATLPAKITNFSGAKIFFSISTRDEVRVSEMETDELTKLPPAFEKEYKSGLWQILYCGDTRTVLLIQKILPEKERYETRAELDRRNAKLRKP